jgi:hypothetical protein
VRLGSSVSCGSSVNVTSRVRSPGTAAGWRCTSKLGDLDGIASADWGLAQIDLDRNDYQPALPR